MAGAGFRPLPAAVLPRRATGGDSRVRQLAGLADDDSVQLREGLEPAGHQCLFAPNWSEAAGILSRVPLDVVVSELA